MSQRRTKPYYSVDCELHRHERLMLCEDPAGCLGLWNALTATIREGEYEEPRVLKIIALAFFRSDPRNVARLTDMIRVGLLTCDDTYVEVLRYEPRNQLRKAIETARKSAKKRMQSVRSNKGRTNSERTQNSECVFAEQPLVVPTSTSLSSGSSLGERVQGENQAPTAPKFTDELKAAVSMIGISDVDLVWVKFIGTGTWKRPPYDVHGAWLKFAGQEAMYQRRDREKGRERDAERESEASRAPARAEWKPKTPDEPLASMDQIHASVAALGLKVGNGGAPA